MTSVLASLRAVSVELPMWQKLICGAGAALALSWSTNTLLAAWEKRRPRYELSRVKVQPENGAAEPYSVNLHVKYELRDPNGPTIVFEHGLGGTLAHFEWISQQLNGKYNIVAYDRAGCGASRPSPVERSTENIAHELNALLEHLGAPGPYILAGMSVGGIHTHTFAQLYPQKVGGLVFIDSSHPAQFERLHMAETMESFNGLGGAIFLSAMSLGLFRSLHFFGLLRRMTTLPPGDALKKLPLWAANDYFKTLSWVSAGRGVLDEAKNFKPSFAWLEHRSALSIPNLPVYVVSAGRFRDMKSKKITFQQFQDIWKELQSNLAAMNKCPALERNNHITDNDVDHTASFCSDGCITAIEAVVAVLQHDTV